MKNLFNIYLGKVCSNEDNTGAGRLKVRLYDDDKKISSTEDLPWSFPLMPKFIHNIPKQGEAVFVFTYKDNPTSDRMWIGPIVPQLHNLDNSDFYFKAKAGLNDGSVDLDKNPELDINSKGVYPNKDDIGLLGRKNTDILLKDNEVWIRAGKYIKTDNKELFNPNQTFIQLKNEERVDNKDKSYKTTANIVADRINLISTQSKDKFNVYDPNDLITIDSMNDILERAHALPYGDVLVDLMKLFLKFSLNHVHNGYLVPPCNDDNMKALNNFNIDDILSETIHIN